MDLGKEELLPFDPGQREFKWKLWVRVVTEDGAYRHVYWRRIAAVAAFAMVAGWVGLSGAVWGWCKYSREVHDAQFVDSMFYPWRRDEFRAALGRRNIELGRLQIEAKNPRAGVMLLTAGVQQAPDDFAGRRALAIVQLRLGRADLSNATLMAGAALKGADLDYMKLVFGRLAELHADDLIVSLATRLLPAQPDRVLLHQFVALHAAKAYYERSHYTEAQRMVQAWGLVDSAEGQILVAQCEAELGQTAQALLRLEVQLTRFPERDDLHVLRIRLAREAGQMAAARRFAVQRQISNPDAAGPRIDLMQTLHATGDRAAYSRELEAYLTMYDRDTVALALAAWFAVDTNQPELARRVALIAADIGGPMQMFHLAAVQTALQVRDYTLAHDLATAALADLPADDQCFGAQIAALRAVALFGLDRLTAARQAIVAVEVGGHLKGDDALLLAKYLSGVGQEEAAYRLLLGASRREPDRTKVLAELVRIESALGNRIGLLDHVPRLLLLRKPPHAVLESALLRLTHADDTALSEAIIAMLQRQPERNPAD